MWKLPFRFTRLHIVIQNSAGCSTCTKNLIESRSRYRSNSKSVLWSLHWSGRNVNAVFLSFVVCLHSLGRTAAFHHSQRETQSTGKSQTRYLSNRIFQDHYSLSDDKTVNKFNSCQKLPYIFFNTSPLAFSAMSSQTSSQEFSIPEDKTVHTANITETHNVPMKILIRPIPSILDEEKVLSLMKTIQNPETADNVPPIDIMWITGRKGGDYYYSFGGCHRYEAFKRLQKETIPCKLFKSTVEDLRTYLGGSTPDLL